MVPIDIERCRRGMRQLNVSGRPRASLISAAIGLIQADPVEAMRREYLGIKNYEAFGDQREDHRYGYGPKHGYIVHRIGRVNESTATPLDADVIYLLEACRDFGVITRKVVEHGRAVERDWNLCDVIRHRDRLAAEMAEMDAVLSAASMTDHAAEIAAGMR